MLVILASVLIIGVVVATVKPNKQKTNLRLVLARVAHVVACAIRPVHVCRMAMVFLRAKVRAPGDTSNACVGTGEAPYCAKK